MENAELPTIEEIKKQYYEIENIMSKVKTVEDARKIENSYGIYIEIGAYDNGAEHCYAPQFDATQPTDIEWFRVESWGKNLAYLYFNIDGYVQFDVYDEYDVLFEDTTIENLERDYNEYLESIREE